MEVKRLGLLAAALGLATAVAAVAFGVATASAPAGNRDAAADFKSFPGPAEVTFGKNVSYLATLKNESGSTFTQVRFGMTRPCVSEGPPSAPACKNFGTAQAPSYLYASLVYSSCAATPTGPFTVGTSGYECPAFANQPAGSPGINVTLVWQTPLLPENVTSCTGCVLWTTGMWTIKESNNTTPSTDTFEYPETNTLLVQPNPVKSAGYALGAVKAANCTTSTANVVTNLNVGSSNKIATAICAGSVPGTLGNPGLVVEVNESTPDTGEGGPGFTDVSDICIPDAGLSCPTSIPYQFTTPAPPLPPDLATFIFRIPETSDWPKGEKLDVAYHDEEPYTEYTCTFVRDGKTKIWTVTCPADENGSWRFG